MHLSIERTGTDVGELKELWTELLSNVPLRSLLTEDIEAYLIRVGGPQLGHTGLPRDLRISTVPRIEYACSLFLVNRADRAT